MLYTPNQPLLIHPKVSPSQGAVWLAGLFGTTPWSETRTTLRVDTLPTWTPSKKPELTPYPRQGYIPTHFPNRRLALWSDHSAVLLERGQEGWEAWPAVLNMPTEILHAAIKTTPYLERASLPTLRLRPDATGIFWECAGADLDDTTLAAYLEAAISQRLAEIKAAPPIRDPRAHPSAGDARFSAFSPFPAPTTHTGVALKDVLGIVALLDSVQYAVYVPPLPQDSWNGRTRKKAKIYNYDLSYTTPWIEWLQKAVQGDAHTPSILTPASAQPSAFARSQTLDAPALKWTSAHQRLQAQATLAHAVGLYWWAKRPT